MKIWNRLDGYVLREIRSPFFLAVVGFTFVLLLNYLFLLAQQTIEKAVPVQLVLGFLLARLPGFLTLTIPMGALLGVLVGIGRLAGQHEIVALRSVGVSVGRLFRPVILAAMLLTVLDLGVSHYLHPMGRLKERALFQEILRARDFSREVDPGVFFDRLPGAVLFASRSRSSTEGRVFEGVLLYREGSQRGTTDLILARRGQGDFDRDTGQVSLRLDDVEWHVVDPARPETYTVVRTPHETLNFPPDPRFLARRRLGKVSGQKELVGLDLYRSVARRVREVATAPSEGSRIAAKVKLRKAVIELSHRWAYPAAVLVLVFAAFPLAARTRRGGRFAGFAQAMGIIFAFWLLFSIGDGLSEQGTLPPWAGSWLAHLVILAWGVTLWLALLRERGEGAGLLARLPAAVGGLLRRRWGAGGQERRRGPRWVQQDRWGGLTRLDTYLASGHLRMLGISLGVLVALVLAVGLKQAIDSVDPAATRFPWADVFYFVGFSLPGQLQFLFPVAALFGVMISLAALARGGEVMALKSCGIGPARISWPLLIVTLLLSLVYAAAQESVVPAAEREAQRSLDRIKGRTRVEAVSTGRRWVAGEPGHFWIYLDWDGGRETLAAPGYLQVDLDRARVLERVEARTARYEDGRWTFAEGWRRRFGGADRPRFESFEALDLPLAERPALFGATRGRLLFDKNLADQMTFRELMTHLRRVSRAGYPAAALLVGLHRKLINPLLPPLLVLVGIPLVVGGSSRRGSLFGFGLALLIAFGFWALLAVTTSLGREGLLSPAVAVWAAPAILFATGSVLLARAR
ncbi:MAG: LptF/LptG family permease [Acidobacteriota bacterium]|nr:LptF/LptG family permease [Acidobacteriota bacterium]MDQ7086783.1 LptF/LptG family permease [Acidobacteriota bacterium]